MAQKHKTGFNAGVVGAVILVSVMALMQVLGLGEPGFVGTYEATIGIGGPSLSWIVAAVLFVVSGGIWGLIYATFIPQSTWWKGALFGFLPSLWLWLVVAPVTGNPLFNGFAPKGILLPILFNVVIWGSFVGWYCAARSSMPHGST